MLTRLLLVVVSCVAVVSAACSFSIGGDEFDKAAPIVDAANKLNTDGANLIKDALDKYDAIYTEAQKADDPFEELGAQAEALKKLEPQLETAKIKLHDASLKLDEAGKLKIPDWYKQYLATLSDFNRSGSDTADIVIEVVKNTYDPSITTPEDLDAKQKVLQAKLADLGKKREDLRKTQTKIESEHKDQFKS